MRILLINQAFHPDVVATAQHMTDWAEYLVSPEGGLHEVTVIASRSVYGKPGASLPKRDSYKNITIHRVGANIFGKRGILARLLDFAAFHFLCLLRALTLPRQDVVVCLTTPPFIGLVGRLVKLFRGSAYIQYEMDIYPDIAIALGALKPGSWPARLTDRLHRHLLRAADRVVVLGRDMQRIIAAKGIAADKLVLVTPWADPDEIVPLPRDTNPFRLAHGLGDKFIVMYSGNLGLGHDTTTITQAMLRLHQQQESAIAFVFIGGGKRMREITEFCQQHSLPTPLILDYQPREKLSETLSAADVHLITQAPGTTGLIVPSKLYGILAAGRPALYIGPADTEVALTLQEHALGQTVAIGEVDAFLAALRQLQQDLVQQPAQAQRARSILREHHSRQSCCRTLTDMVTKLR